MRYLGHRVNFNPSSESCPWGCHAFGQDLSGVEQAQARTA